MAMWKNEAVAYILLPTADEIKSQTGSIFTVHLENGQENNSVQEKEKGKVSHIVSYMFSCKVTVMTERKDTRFCSYICSDVIEFCDKGMFDDINCNFRGDNHKNVREQHPQVIWEGEKKVNYFSQNFWKDQIILQYLYMYVSPCFGRVLFFSMLICYTISQIIEVIF